MIPATSADVVVIGGGITGLSAAQAVLEDRPGASVVLLESSDRLGGKIATIDLDGIALETGADSFLARTPDAVSLCERIGLGDELVSPAVFGAVIADRDGVHRLPSGFVYGLPSSVGAALGAHSLSIAGRLRACRDLFLPGRITDDVSVAAFVTRRFGGQVLDKVVDPLLAGTRAGRVEDMSLAAAMPQIFGVAHSSRSVIRGLDRASKKGVVDNGRPPFLTVSGGLGRVIETLRDRLPAVDVRMETEAIRLERASGYTITTNQGSIEAAAVIVATPAYVAAPLLDGVSGGAAAALRTIEHASVASVALVYEHLDFSPPQGTSGLLVSRSVQQVIAGCTWYSTKWPGSVPDGRSVLRCVVGRAGSDPALETGDDVLSAAVINDVERLLAVHDTPIRTHVTRWHRGLPQYSVGHLQRIDYAENALRRDAPGVMVAGAGLRGSGIPDCIAQGRQAATAAIRSLQPK